MKDKEKEANEPKKARKVYLVLKGFTGEKVHSPGEKVKLDPEAHSTKLLLTNKFIK